MELVTLVIILVLSGALALVSARQVLGLVLQLMERSAGPVRHTEQAAVASIVSNAASS